MSEKLKCKIRYFNENGEMFSSYSIMEFKGISMIEGVSKIKELWKSKGLPNLSPRYYPRYVHVEMQYDEDGCHDNVFLLDFSEGLSAEKWFK